MASHTSLKNLTLVMPTYNRDKYAKRSINFWSGTKVNLIVLDGSVNPLELDFTSKLSPNIKYMHNQDPWIDRIVLGSNLSNTSFTMLICDDEFYLPSALDLLISELNSNETITSVNGMAVAFYPFARRLYFRRIYTNFKDASIEHDDPVKRVEAHMMPYAMTGLYGMHRTKVFKKNAEVAKICSLLPDPASFELGFEIANSHQGKTRILPIVSRMRSMENPPIWDTKAMQTHILWKNKMLNNLSEVSYGTEKILNPGNYLENTLEKQILYNGLLRYVSNFSSKKKVIKDSSAKSNIKKFVPYRFYFFFTWLYMLCSKNSILTTWLSRKKLLNQLVIEKITISIDDLNVIENFVKRGEFYW
jgi:glycosyltransferase domain-containing protein